MRGPEQRAQMVDFFEALGRLVNLQATAAVETFLL